MFWNMFLTTIHKVEDTIKEKIPSLKINTFNLNEIEKLLKKLDKDNKDSKLLEEYYNKKIKCSVCNKNLSEDINEFGGSILNKKGKWIILCRDLDCYNKSLSK